MVNYREGIMYVVKESWPVIEQLDAVWAGELVSWLHLARALTQVAEAYRRFHHEHR